MQKRSASYAFFPLMVFDKLERTLLNSFQKVLLQWASWQRPMICKNSLHLLGARWTRLWHSCALKGSICSQLLTYRCRTHVKSPCMSYLFLAYRADEAVSTNIQIGCQENAAPSLQQSNYSFSFFNRVTNSTWMNSRIYSFHFEFKGTPNEINMNNFHGCLLSKFNCKTMHRVWNFNSKSLFFYCVDLLNSWIVFDSSSLRGA